MFELRLRRGTSSDWLTRNPVLQTGEPGYETNTGKLKIGNGSTPWSELPYINPDGSGGASSVELTSHIESLTPHPVYDDGPSLLLLYQNAKV